MTSNIFATTHDEVVLDKALKILSVTIPEAGADAMSDYAKALRLLYEIKDPRITPLIDRLENLYAYPERKTHNLLLADFHDLRETLLESSLEKKLVEMDKPSSLGQTDRKTLAWKWPMLLVVLGIIFACRKK